MPSKEELLTSIRPGMKLTKEFLKRIYSYGITDASFPDRAVSTLEAAGCSKARQYYTDWVTAYEEVHKAEIKPVAAWYRQECGREWERRQKEGEEKRKREQTKPEIMNRKQQWMKLSEILGYQLTRTEK